MTVAFFAAPLPSPRRRWTHRPVSTTARESIKTIVDGSGTDGAKARPVTVAELALKTFNPERVSLVEYTVPYWAK
jgi:hypothetical protein